VGLHNLLIQIENSFLTNNTIIQSVEVWSQTEITIQHSNILHFASPGQEISIIAQLKDWSGNISSQSLYLLCNDEIVTSSTTDLDGIAILSIMAPAYEGLYNLSIVYPMNETRYELLAKSDYHLTVTSSIPVLVNLEYYEIIHPLQQVSISLKVQCLNGSLLAGIPIKIVWQSLDDFAMTREGGLSTINLPVPSVSGDYQLHYEIESTNNLAASAGTITIQISIADVLASQGIGINGFAIAIMTSFLVVAIPLIKQRYLTI
jgi:hypothetical protein